MDEVYRATDTKLDRDVALKLLPEACTSDQQRMARFAREVKVSAFLNHPNIASIYGLEEAHGKQALVLELVEGEDLAERIGVETSNVKITPEGPAKVLDFGAGLGLVPEPSTYPIP